MQKYIEISVIEIKQKIGNFYLGKITPKDLHTIANDSLSRLEDLEEGIQRDKDPKKVSEIKEYIQFSNWTFPNTIILSIQKNLAELDEPDYVFDEKKSILKIKLSDAVANILDGQHRLAGFNKDEQSFELPVSIFLDLSLGDQAKIFAKINSTQKKVSLNLVYDLFGITKERSYERSAFYIVKHLNEENDSPWFKKVKTLSDKTGDLAQGSMAKYIHKELLEKNKIFSDLYRQKRDTDIKNILKNYFNAIKKTFPKKWENENNSYILTKTTGFNGFMNFFVSLVRLSSINKRKLSVEYFEYYLSRTIGKFEDFTSDNYPSGAVGQNRIRDVLRESLSEEEKIVLKLRK